MKSKQLICAAIAALAFEYSAIAGTMLVDSHIARQGRDRDAMLECMQALRAASPSLGQGLVLAQRVRRGQDDEGRRMFMFDGTAWRDGARERMELRCSVGPRQQVARLTRVTRAPASVASAVRSGS